MGLPIASLLGGFSVLGMVGAQYLATVTPCPACPTSASPPVIYVTQQYQPVSTCTPTTSCTYGGCTTAYPFQTYDWVSSVIPCYKHGRTTMGSCTVTKTEQVVTICHDKATVTSTQTPYPTMSGYKPVNYSNSSSNAIYVDTYEKICKIPYYELGPHALPNYEGSGLCQDCEEEYGLEYQPVQVTECFNGDCTYEMQTWIYGSYAPPTGKVTGPTPTTVAATSYTYLMPGTCTYGGIPYTVTAPTTITYPYVISETTGPKTHYAIATTTTACHSPGTYTCGGTTTYVTEATTCSYHVPTSYIPSHTYHTKIYTETTTTADPSADMYPTKRAVEERAAEPVPTFVKKMLRSARAGAASDRLVRRRGGLIVREDVEEAKSKSKKMKRAIRL